MKKSLSCTCDLWTSHKSWSKRQPSLYPNVSHETFSNLPLRCVTQLRASVLRNASRGSLTIWHCFLLSHTHHCLEPPITPTLLILQQLEKIENLRRQGSLSLTRLPTLRSRPWWHFHFLRLLSFRCKVIHWIDFHFQCVLLARKTIEAPGKILLRRQIVNRFGSKPWHPVSSKSVVSHLQISRTTETAGKRHGVVCLTLSGPDQAVKGHSEVYFCRISATFGRLSTIISCVVPVFTRVGFRRFTNLHPAPQESSQTLGRNL